MSHDFGDRLAHCRAIVLTIKSAKLPPFVSNSLAELDHHLDSLFKEFHSNRGKLR